MGSKSTGNFDFVHFLYAHTAYHQFAAGIKRSLGKLYLSDILLGNYNVFVDTGLCGPGQHKFRPAGIRVFTKAVGLLALFVEYTTFGDDAGFVKLGQQIQNPGAADTLGFHILGFGVTAPGISADDFVIHLVGLRIDFDAFHGSGGRPHPVCQLRTL